MINANGGRETAAIFIGISILGLLRDQNGQGS